MAGSLETPNGLVLFGTASDVNVAVTPAVLANGVTYLSDPIAVPPGAGVVSFEIRASNVSGAPTLTVKVRGGNRGVGTLIDRGITSPTALAAISGAVGAIVSIASDCAYVQLEIACSGGANANLSVVATVLRGSPAVESAIVQLSGAISLAASSAVIGHAIVDSSGLPTGAATAAKQPALGTAGTASTDVITVQGIASGTPQPVSAASLPLPSGASTAAKQPALGTAGTPSADVLSIQGAASMKELLVQLIASTAVIGHVIPDSPTSLNHGSETVTTGSTAIQLDSGTSHPCSQVTICVDANAGLIILGKATGNNIAAGARLQPLCTYVIPISNTNLLWFNGATVALVSANGYTFSWFAT